MYHSTNISTYIIQDVVVSGKQDQTLNTFSIIRFDRRHKFVDVDIKILPTRDLFVDGTARQPEEVSDRNRFSLRERNPGKGSGLIGKVEFVERLRGVLKK